MTESGDVVVDGIASIESLRQGQRGLSSSRHAMKTKSNLHERQGWIEITRDMTSIKIYTFSIDLFFQIYLYKRIFYFQVAYL